MVEPVDLDRRLADPNLYEDVILSIFAKRNRCGQAFAEASDGITYFDTATRRRSFARAVARSVSAGDYRPQAVQLWHLESKGKTRAAHTASFSDHVVGSALYRLLSINARCYGLPGVYSYLPGMSNVKAMRALATYVRAHRNGQRPQPLFVLQSDFDHYGDGLPIGPDAPLWPIVREVAALGSPNGEISTGTWNLITELARPVVHDTDADFVRLNGVAMGTPLVPLLSNLAVAPMDRAVLGIDGIFYARFNDDFILAHPDLEAIRDADALIDSLTTELGVRRKTVKEMRTALSGNGMAHPEAPDYRGGNRIDCLGLSVSHAGTLTVGPHRLRRFIVRVCDRIRAAASTLDQLPENERARHIVAATNVMLDTASPFAIAGLPALLDTTTDRGVLKDLDFRIMRAIVQAATGRPGLRGLRVLPPHRLYGEFGLTSLVNLRNTH